MNISTYSPAPALGAQAYALPAAPGAPGTCPVITEFVHQLKHHLSDEAAAAPVVAEGVSPALMWARASILIDHVTRTCIPEAFSLCGRQDTARYLVNLPPFGIGSQLGLYYNALKRCLKGELNRYLEPCLEKLAQFVDILRRDAVSKAVPHAAIAALCYFVALRDNPGATQELLVKLTNVRVFA